MVKLYYGSGYCNVEGDGVRGIEIRGLIKADISKTCGDNFVLMTQTDAIIIFPISTSGTLTDLFTYKGNMVISSVIACDENAKEIACTINTKTDYSEAIDTKAEDLTVVSERLNASYVYKGNRTKSNTDNNIVKNLRSDGEFYLKNGSVYSGAYHIHLEDNKCMTGKEHTEDSVDLYIKQMKNGQLADELVHTENPSHTPLGSKVVSKRRIVP